MKQETSSYANAIEPSFFGSRIVTPLGEMLAIANAKGLCLLEFINTDKYSEQNNRIQKKLKGKIIYGQHAFLSDIERELQLYFQGKLKSFAVPLALDGTAFQVAVCERLLEIPYGETLSYGELAASVGLPGGSRAVGRANGENPLAIVVPCHRVIRADGHLCGYGGGLWRKKCLLELEQGVRSLI